MWPELDAFAAELDDAINVTLEGEVAEGAKAAISEAVQSEVYDAYFPIEYDRRGLQSGGLADANVMAAQLNPFAHELTVTDESRDNDSGRLIAPVVESGQGYEWSKAEIARSRMPRPFHEIAEERFAESGEFEEALTRGLEKQGFEVR